MNLNPLQKWFRAMNSDNPVNQNRFWKSLSSNLNESPIVQNSSPFYSVLSVVWEFGGSSIYDLEMADDYKNEVEYLD